ncbi:MAG: cytochrome b/b6 domain-containing protein [Pseudomonadota bacterium]|nr:cytochrome b/b6 domain-containing protein [Pseudomonadota bacterium]
MHNKSHLHKVHVWDLPTRFFHWALVAGVIGLGLSGTLGGNAMVWHFRLGYAVLALLLFRGIWGLVGGRWSRFGAFLYGPQSLVNSLKGQVRPEHGVGHSPLGALSVFAMLGVLLAQVASGLLSDDEIAFAGPLTGLVPNATVSLATQYHSEIGKWLLLGLVVLHVAAIMFYLHRKNNLVNAMLHGDKEMALNAPSSRDDALSRTAALLILVVCAALSYWVSTLEGSTF